MCSSTLVQQQCLHQGRRQEKAYSSTTESQVLGWSSTCSFWNLADMSGSETELFFNELQPRCRFNWSWWFEHQCINSLYNFSFSYHIRWKTWNSTAGNVVVSFDWPYTSNTWQEDCHTFWDCTTSNCSWIFFISLQNQQFVLHAIKAAQKWSRAQTNGA